MLLILVLIIIGMSVGALTGITGASGGADTHHPGTQLSGGRRFQSPGGCNHDYYSHLHVHEKEKRIRDHCSYDGTGRGSGSTNRGENSSIR